LFCLFLESPRPGLVDAKLCRRVLLHTPARAHDPFLDDGAPPATVAQLYFESLQDLEASAAALGEPWAGAEAMDVRSFAVPDPRIRAADGAYCTYLVAYEGPAQDEAAWHAHYLTDHPPLMARLPGIRELEVYAPLDWRFPPGLALRRHLQRNKVAFDSPEALSAALNSPVRREMRASYGRLPPFSGRVTHYPMITRIVHA
jgi:uncharacterized protein (TIGR02118 family)